MDWINDIQKAINYIENNLLKGIRADEISKNVYASSDHFQKMFNMVTGFTVNEYIRNRKLSLAAQELYLEKTKVIDVALKYGYETHESFTKAFLRFHGITPSAARNSKRNLKYFVPLSIQINVKGGFIMSKKVIPNLEKFMNGMNGENFAFCGAMAQLMAIMDENNYDYEFVNNKQFINNKEKYLDKIIQWIDKGIPVIVRDNNYSCFTLAVGYNDNGDILKFNLHNDNFEVYNFDITENSIFAFVFLGERIINPDIKEIYRSSIYDIPNLITKKATYDACFGREAIVEWANGLVDGRYDNIPQDRLDVGNICSNFLICLGTIGCMKKFIKKILDINPDMKDLIDSIYNISAESDTIFHFLLKNEGFDFNLESLKNKDYCKMMSDKIKENLIYYDKLLNLFKDKKSKI